VSGLSEEDLRVLALERQWWQRQGAKDAVIKDLFGWSATEYHRRLNALIDRPEALAHDPVVVKRLRDRRERGSARRHRMRLAEG
jgi:hypothetical protein